MRQKYRGKTVKTHWQSGQNTGASRSKTVGQTRKGQVIHNHFMEIGRGGVSPNPSNTLNPQIQHMENHSFDH